MSIFSGRSPERPCFMRILDKKRSKYKRSFSDGMSCIFCEKRDLLECPSLSGKFWSVIVNKFPYMDGNVMIVPNRHVEDIEQIRSDEWKDFGLILTKTKKVLGEIFEVDSFNVGLNMGPQSGASIAHLHWQVVPRKFKNITAMNVFADLHIVAVSPEETKQRIDEKTANFSEKEKGMISKRSKK